MHSFSIRNIPQALMTSVIGKQRCKVAALEEQLSACIEADYSMDTITVWAEQHHLQAAADHIRGLQNEYK
jgi:hypothetical protein